MAEGGKKFPVMLIVGLIVVGLILAGGISYFIATKVMGSKADGKGAAGRLRRSLPGDDGLRFRRAGLLEAGPLLGQCAREVESLNHAHPHEHLTEPLARLAVDDKRLFELLLGGHATLDEDLAKRASGGGIGRVGILDETHRRRWHSDGAVPSVGPLHRRPLFREHARELDPRHPERRDEHLSDHLAGALLNDQRLFELLIGDEATLDEYLADEA